MASEEFTQTNNSKNEVFYFIECYKKVVEIAIVEKVFIAYNNKSKYSDLYYKIEKDIFENYVKTYLDMEVKTFFEYAVLLAPIILLLAMLPGYDLNIISTWFRKILENQLSVLVLTFL